MAPQSHRTEGKTGPGQGQKLATQLVPVSFSPLSSSASSMACLTLVQDGQGWVGYGEVLRDAQTDMKRRNKGMRSLPTPHFPGAVFEKREKEMKER